MPWIPAILLGLGLAASTGLRTFLPLLLLALAAHFHVGNINLGSGYSWLSSDTALYALGFAALLEMLADKIPLVDHALNVVGTVARPLAAALAAASVLPARDPASSALLGLLLAGPVAFGFHAAKSTGRGVASAGTFGLATPMLSIIEDCLALGLALASLAAPILVPFLLVPAFLVIWKIFHVVKSRRAPRTSAARA